MRCEIASEGRLEDMKGRFFPLLANIVIGNGNANLLPVSHIFYRKSGINPSSNGIIRLANGLAIFFSKNSGLPSMRKPVVLRGTTGIYN